MGIDEAIRSFKLGALELDCIDMTLTQCATDTPIVVNGKGYIRQDADGQLEFKQYTWPSSTDDAIKRFNESCGDLPGKLFDPGRYYDLRAIDFNGQVWTAEHIMFHEKSHFSGEAIISGQLRSLRLQEPRKSLPPKLIIHLYDKLLFPSRMGGLVKKAPITSTHQIAGREFEFVQEPDCASVTVSSPTAFSPFFYLRVVEALTFVTAQNIGIRALVEEQADCRTLDLISPLPAASKVRMFPPLSLNSWMLPNSGVEIFRCYLEYVNDDARGDYWHHMTYFVHNAAEGSAGSVDSWAIGLSVAVEGLASLIPLEISAEERNRLKLMGKCVRTRLAEDGRFSDLEDRLNGLVGSMSQVRPQDRLHHLSATGQLKASDIKIWSSLRNRHVHPKASDLHRGKDRDFQSLFDEIGATTTLMYQIIFHLIGYSGAYTDYGTKGYPDATYPPATEVPNEAALELNIEGRA